MKPTQQIKELQKQIANLQQEISHCSHDFDNPKFDPDFKFEGYGGHYTVHGSDPVYEYHGYDKKEVPRWSRECKKCGHTEYTTQVEPIITGTQPKF